MNINILGLVLGYIFGNFPSGYLYAKAHGVDIFSAGSKSPGTTNISRTLGKRAGVTVFLMDSMKTILPILLMHMIFLPNMNNTQPDIDKSILLTLFTGLGVVLGHCFPIPIKGMKGGKGIACAVTLVLCYDFKYALMLLLVWYLMVLVSGYVSFGSCLIVIIFLLIQIIPGRYGLMSFSADIYIPVVILSAILVFTILFRHRANIKRLIKGEEKKFHFKK